MEQQEKKGKKKLELELSKENCSIVEKTITDGILQCYGRKIPREFILCNHSVKKAFLTQGDPYTIIPVSKITFLKLIPDFGDALDLEEEEKCCKMLAKHGFEKDLDYIKNYACLYRKKLKESVVDQASKEGIPKKKDPHAYMELKKEWTNPKFIPFNHISKDEKRFPLRIEWTRKRKIVSLATFLPSMSEHDLTRTGVIETLASYLAVFINRNVIYMKSEIYFSYSMIPEGGERVKLILFISQSTDGDDIDEKEPYMYVERKELTPELVAKLDETIEQYREKGIKINEVAILNQIIASHKSSSSS